MYKHFLGCATAAGLGLLTAGGAAAQTQCGVILFFANGQTALSGAEQTALAANIAANPGAYSLAGYTDSTGSAAANASISQRRAENVASIVRAVSGSSVTSATGQGEATRPGTTGPADPRNRRVEVIKDGCVGPGAQAPGDASAGLGVAATVGALGVLAVMTDDDSSSGSTSGTGGSN
ncbi:OmpA family protein [Primorskyibacter flagellatus]|uniref:OmpA family protein n=1 Tax=Primorskyibacter flagellatus TaxID=1387277 RepID=A0A1W2ANH6_9RHOB|nr:OmpA family protein [Primorskyibacter flagellatus]SMC62080.1 OmpA family protein [Primorskyibacter flagellatus]